MKVLNKIFDLKNNRLLTKKELANYLGVSIGKIDMLMKKEIKFIKIGRNVRFNQEDIRVFIDGRTVNSYN